MKEVFMTKQNKRIVDLEMEIIIGKLTIVVYSDGTPRYSSIEIIFSETLNNTYPSITNPNLLQNLPQPL